MTTEANTPIAPAVTMAPASYGQTRLWFLQQLAPSSPLWNVPSAAWLHGALDVEALRSGLDALVARHEILHVGLVAVDGIPHQRIEATVSCPLRVCPIDENDAIEAGADAEGPSRESARREAVLRRAREEACRPFDLNTAPLARAVLFPVAPDCHLLLLVLHHTVTDGW